MVEWIASKGVHIDEHLTHVPNTQLFTQGDVVIGILPLHLIAELNHAGILYMHISLDLDAEHRGIELSAEQLSKFNPRLERFEVLKYTP